MNLETGKIVGQTTEGIWVQVHDFTPEGEKLHKRGRLVAGICLHWADVGGAVSAGREALARLHELYYGELLTDPLSALKHAVVTMGQDFPQAEMVALAIVDRALYVVVAGHGGVWLRQEGREGWLVDPNRQSADIAALSGWLQPGAAVVAGNSKFWQVVTLGAVRAAVSNSTSAVEVGETLATVVHGNTLATAAVGVVLRVQTEPASVGPALEVKRPRLPVFVSAVDRVRRGRKTMWVGVGFLIILLILVGAWQWQTSYITRKTSEENVRIEAIMQKFTEAKALVDLNPVRSRQILTEVEEEIRSLSESKSAQKDPRLIGIVEEFGRVLEAASGIKAAEAREVMDLTWLREGMKGDDLALLPGSLLVLDNGESRIAVINPDKRGGEILVGRENLGQTRFLAVYPGKITILSDKGIVQCVDNGAGCQVVVEAGLPAVVDMHMFAGNIYTLSDGGIGRYQITDQGYSQGQNWLAAGQDAGQLVGARSMAIDASIWVVRRDGQVLKYNQGVREDFSLFGLDKPLSDTTDIFTDPDTDSLYFLDRGGGRIAVIDKTGKYLSQYPTDLAGQATSFVVDEKKGKIYLLVGSKIWAIDL